MAQLAELFSIPARIVEIDDAQALEWQLVEKSGKSASHIYARLSLLQLVPAVADAFTQERITASHAKLIARLPPESQAEAYEQCWRKDWQEKEAHLLPAKSLSA